MCAGCKVGGRDVRGLRKDAFCERPIRWCRGWSCDWRSKEMDGMAMAMAMGS